MKFYAIVCFLLILSVADCKKRRKHRYHDEDEEDDYQPEEDDYPAEEDDYEDDEYRDDYKAKECIGNLEQRISPQELDNLISNTIKEEVMNMKTLRPDLLPKGDPGKPGMPGKDGFTCECELTSTMVHDQRYVILNRTESRNKAWIYHRSDCRTKKMHLATVYTERQWRLLKDTIRRRGLANEDVWIGGAQMKDVYNLVWFDYGLPVNPSIINIQNYRSYTCGVSNWCCLYMNKGSTYLRSCEDGAAYGICSHRVR